MNKLEEQLKVLILKSVDFQIDGKSIKRGRIKIFNSKQFHVRFKIESGGDIKEFDLPYPYKIIPTDDGYIFDYTLSAFIPRTEETFWKMKCMNRGDSSRLFDNYLHILTLSS